MSTRRDADAADGGIGDDARHQLERLAATLVPDEHDWAGMSEREIYVVVLRHLTPDYVSSGDTSTAYLRGRFEHAVRRFGRTDGISDAQDIGKIMRRGYDSAVAYRQLTSAPAASPNALLATRAAPRERDKTWIPDWKKPLAYTHWSAMPDEIAARAELTDWRKPLSYTAKGHGAVDVLKREGRRQFP